MSIDYDAIETAVATHLISELDSAIYLVTQDYTASMNQTKVPVSVCVMYSGFAHEEALGQSPNTPTRDMMILISIMARGDTDRLQGQRLNDASSVIEEACEAPGHGAPIFAYEPTLLERCLVVSAGPKVIIEGKGMSMPMVLAIRIMED